MAELELLGIYPPVVTPINEDETVDEAGLCRLLKRLIDGGVHGLFFLGSTGEFVALRDRERRRALEICVREAKGKVPIVVGTMDSSTKRVMDNIRAAKELGADAVAVTPTYYYPSSGEADILNHYKACAESSDLPVVIYNIPSTTKVMISAETVAKIAKLPNVVGIKDSSGDFAHLMRMLFALRERPDFSIMVGFPPIAGPAMLLGADGAVMSLANIHPALCIRLYDAAKAKNVDEVYRLQKQVQSLMQLLSFGPAIVCMKTALELLGICQSHATAPFPPLKEDDRQKIAALLKEHGLL